MVCYFELQESLCSSSAPLAWVVQSFFGSQPKSCAWVGLGTLPLHAAVTRTGFGTDRIWAPVPNLSRGRSVDRVLSSNREGLSEKWVNTTNDWFCWCNKPGKMKILLDNSKFNIQINGFEIQGLRSSFCSAS